MIGLLSSKFQVLKEIIEEQEAAYLKHQESCQDLDIMRTMFLERKKSKGDLDDSLRVSETVLLFLEEEVRENRRDVEAREQYFLEECGHPSSW